MESPAPEGQTSVKEKMLTLWNVPVQGGTRVSRKAPGSRPTKDYVFPNLMQDIIFS